MFLSPFIISFVLNRNSLLIFNFRQPFYHHKRVNTLKNYFDKSYTENTTIHKKILNHHLPPFPTLIGNFT